MNTNRFTLTKDVIAQALVDADLTPGATNNIDVPFNAVRIKLERGGVIQISFCHDNKALMTKSQTLCNGDELNIFGIKGTFPMSLTT